MKINKMTEKQLVQEFGKQKTVETGIKEDVK
jgi:hypothetical protein